jgi:DNA-binding transcriptional regulator GbsR (MarR family)
MAEQGSPQVPQPVALATERMAATFVDWGMSPTPARILMALTMTQAEGLTAAELAAQLGASPAAISGGVRYLIQFGLVRRERRPGSRRDLYLLPDDAWYESSTSKESDFAKFAVLTEQAVRALDAPGSPAEVRVIAMRDFFAFVGTRMGQLLRDWEEIKAAQRSGD